MHKTQSFFRFFRLQQSLWVQLDRANKKHFLFAIFVAVASSAAELASLALGPLLIRQVSNQNPYSTLTLAIGLPIVLISLGLRIWDLRNRYGLTSQIQFSISHRLLRSKLFESVSDLSTRNEAAFISALTQDLIGLGSIITYQMIMASNAILTLMIILGLSLISPSTTLFVMGLSLTYYALTTYLTARQVERLGSIALQSQQQILSELRQLYGIAFNLFDQIGSTSSLTKRADSTNCNLFKSQANANLIISLPKVIIDHIVVFILLIAVLWVAKSSGQYSVGDKISLLVLYLLSFNRLLPCLQQIYLAVSVINQNKTSLRRITSCLLEIEPNLSSLLVDDSLLKPLNTSQTSSQNPTLTLDQLQYSSTNKLIYSQKPNSESSLGFSASISPGQILWIKGESGVGKSTLLQIISGFRKPVSGKIYLDSNLVDLYLNRSWISSVAYVPQQVFVLPVSIEENITLSHLKPHDPSVKRVREVVSVAQLSDLSLDTVLSDFNSGLSGGQQQRIAIARALYQCPRLLILDEATTGIDLKTRKILFESLRIYAQSHQISVVVVSHDELPIVADSVVNVVALANVSVDHSLI